MLQPTSKQLLTNSLGKGRIIVIVLVLILLIALAVILPMLSKKPPQLEPLEVSQLFGNPQVYSKQMKKWISAERGMKLYVQDKIRVDKDSGLDMKLPDRFYLRVKGNTELEIDAGVEKGRMPHHVFEMAKGDILGTTDSEFDPKTSTFEVATPLLVTAVRGTKFYIHGNEDGSYSWIASLMGSLEVRTRPGFGKKPEMVMLKSLQKATLKKGETISEPTRVAQDDWKLMKEAYELLPKSAAFEALQLDLSKRAGEIYEKYVFDHGTFYTPKIGFASREFKEDLDTSKVFLEVEYDVFPRGSYVGIYNKTRKYDLSEYHGFSFEIRRKPGESYPDWFRIELKAKGATMRSYAVKNIDPNWETKTFKFSATKEVPITEMTFVFSHEKVGQDKKGFVQMRNFSLVPLTEDELKRRKAIQERQKERELEGNDSPQRSTRRSAPLAILDEEVVRNRAASSRPATQRTPPKPKAPEKPKKISLDDLPPADF